MSDYHSGTFYLSFYRFFSPKYLEGLDTFQDAGILQNNPLALALSEFTSLHQGDALDVVLNLGTGSPPSARLRNKRVRPIRDMWAVRVLRAFMSSMNGTKTWSDLSSLFKRIPSFHAHYRLDLTITDLPALDDTAKINDLKSLVQNDSRLQSMAKEVAHRLFVSLFYFQLTSIPHQGEEMLLQVTGNILCIRKCPDPALDQICQRFLDSGLFINGIKKERKVKRDKFGNMYVPVRFETNGVVDIQIQESSVDTSCAISGLPVDIQVIVKQSGLVNYFGSSTHKRKHSDVDESLVNGQWKSRERHLVRKRLK